MTFSDALSVVAIFLAIVAWVFPDAMNPIRVRYERWKKESKFTGAKRELRSVRRQIATLKRTRSSAYNMEYLVSLTFLSVCFLGLSLSLISAMSWVQADINREYFRERGQNVSLFLAFCFYVLTIFGRNYKSPKNYRSKLLKLNSKRKQLVEKLTHAEKN
jgi:hypothetical protein